MSEDLGKISSPQSQELRTEQRKIVNEKFIKSEAVASGSLNGNYPYLDTKKDLIGASSYDTKTSLVYRLKLEKRSLKEGDIRKIGGAFDSQKRTERQFDP